MNIAPDVNCPQCGMVIVCPHTPCVPYPPHCVNEPPPRIEWDGKTFLERVVQRKMYEAAQEYATNGWEVFPLHGKAPAIAKYRGGNGVHDATANVGQVSAWWSGPHKGCNIGIRVPESMFVLDVDGPHRHPRPGRGYKPSPRWKSSTGRCRPP